MTFASAILSYRVWFSENVAEKSSHVWEGTSALTMGCPFTPAHEYSHSLHTTTPPSPVVERSLKVDTKHTEYAQCTLG